MILLLLACAAPPPAPTRGVVSLHDVTTEIVVGLGRAGDLVAISAPQFLSPAAEAATAEVPRLDMPLSAEALLALAPAVVLGTEDVPEHQPELRDFTGSTWIDPAGLDGLWAAIGQVGAALDAPTDTYVARLRAALPPPVAGDLPVFVYDCCEPPLTMGGRAPLTELLARLGARNVFATLDQDWGTVSWEAAVVTRPALVVIDAYDGEGDVETKRAVVRAYFGDVPTVVLPLAFALEGPRTLEAPAILAPAIAAARAAR